MTSFVYLLHKKLLTAEQKLIAIIQLLLKGYYEDLPTMDLINPEKEKDFIKFRVELTEKVAEHEQS